MSQNTNYIKVRQDHIEYGFEARYVDDGNMYSWYIPAYDIYFSSPKDTIEGARRAKAMVKAFYVSRFEKEKQDLKSFLIEIYKLGFYNPDHDKIIKALTDAEIREGSFKSSGDFGHREFRNAEAITHEDSYAIAA